MERLVNESEEVNHLRGCCGVFVRGEKRQKNGMTADLPSGESHRMIGICAKNENLRVADSTLTEPQLERCLLRIKTKWNV